ncbi:VOC family protein [Streptomyces sp. NPDC001914]|uniref:VOC family protein n=1 Tax=Streptomyces sp. NPDC001914 TaxID=3364623 RepID=UPI0036AA87EF
MEPHITEVVGDVQNIKPQDDGMRVEVVVIPVSDVDSAKQFYEQRLGWRLDVTPPGVVQFTPPGSDCSVQFGTGLSDAPPGSAKGYLIVSDVVSTRDRLVSHGVDVSEVFHKQGESTVTGPDPERRSYFSRATFDDPDGNVWLLQEVTTRLPGRIDTGRTSFGSASELASAMRRAKEAHGAYEESSGQPDANWPEWYANYMAREQTGEALPG